MPLMQDQERYEELERLVLLCDDPINCSLQMIGCGLAGLLSNGMPKEQIKAILIESVDNL